MPNFRECKRTDGILDGVLKGGIRHPNQRHQQGGTINQRQKTDERPYNTRNHSFLRQQGKIPSKLRFLPRNRYFHKTGSQKHKCKKGNIRSYHYYYHARHAKSSVLSNLFSNHLVEKTMIIVGMVINNPAADTIGKCAYEPDDAPCLIATLM